MLYSLMMIHSFLMKILVKSYFLLKNYILDYNFYDDDPEAIIHVWLLAWCNKFEKHKALKKDISK